MKQLWITQGMAAESPSSPEPMWKENDKKS
jgi:hypothetical protein